MSLSYPLQCTSSNRISLSKIYIHTVQHIYADDLESHGARIQTCDLRINIRACGPVITPSDPRCFLLRTVITRTVTKPARCATLPEDPTCQDGNTLCSNMGFVQRPTCVQEGATYQTANLRARDRADCTRLAVRRLHLPCNSPVLTRYSCAFRSTGFLFDTFAVRGEPLRVFGALLETLREVRLAAISGCWMLTLSSHSGGAEVQGNYAAMR